jgi:hypothetical protein
MLCENDKKRGVYDSHEKFPVLGKQSAFRFFFTPTKQAAQ